MLSPQPTKKEIITYKESILGDMHDGIGGVVATGTILAQAALDDEDIASKNQKIAQIAHLLENGSFELRSMLNILDKKTNRLEFIDIRHERIQCYCSGIKKASKENLQYPEMYSQTMWNSIPTYLYSDYLKR